MQVFSGKIINGIESVGSTPLFLSSQIIEVSEMSNLTILYFCRRCKTEITPTAHQIKKRDFICRECNNLHLREWRRKRKEQGNPVKSTQMPIEYHRQYDKIYYKKPEVRERLNKRANEYSKNAEVDFKNKARRKTRTAIENGTLVQLPCEVCGLIKVDAHHDDYTKPLEVRWLCRTHHTEWHQQAKAKGENL